MPQKLDMAQWQRRTDRALVDLYKKLRLVAGRADALDAVASGSAIKPDEPVPTLLKNVDGKTFVNTLKQYVRPYVFRMVNGATITVTGSSSATGVFAPPAESGITGDCEIFGFALTSYTSDRFRVMLTHTGIQRRLMNARTWGPAVFGDVSANGPIYAGSPVANPEPMWLDASVFLEANQNLEVEFTDFSGASNVIGVAAVGRRFLDFDNVFGLSREDLINAFRLRDRNYFSYWYTNDERGLLDSSGDFDVLLTLSRDIKFAGKYAIDARSTGETTGRRADFDYNVTLRDGRSGTTLVDNVSRVAVFGTSATSRRKLPDTWYVRAGSTSLCNINAGSGESGNVVDVVFHGRAINAPDLKDSQQQMKLRTAETDGDFATGVETKAEGDPSHKDLRTPIPFSVG